LIQEPIKRSFTRKRQFHIFIPPSPALKIGEPPLRKKKKEATKKKNSEEKGNATRRALSDWATTQKITSNAQRVGVC
jgi:hypothetical protein